MKTLNIREWKHYSKAQLLKFMDEDTFEKLQKYAIINRDYDSYQFNYVGVIIIDRLVINSYPKYFTNYSSDEFKQVIRVIKKYNASNELDYQNEELEDISYNHLSLMVFFLEDYFEYGIYNNTQNILEVNGNGEIDWNRTIHYTDPIIKDDKPYYVEMFTKHNISDLYDYFRLLHEYIITTCSRKLENAGLLNLFDLTPVELSDKVQDDFGEIEIILEKLEKELYVEFSTRKIKLLKAMHTFLKCENSFSNQNYLTLFGTAAYHEIWEEMCRKVFNDKLNSIVEFKGSKIRLIDIIEKPIWCYMNKFSNKAEGTFIPDTVTFRKDNFVILDAKYYSLKFGEHELSGQPGFESIVKQYMYEMAFKEFIKEKGFKKVKNAFLFPKYDGEIENIGHVELKILKDLADIQVIMLPAGEINKCYLENKKIDIERLSI